MTRLRLRCVVGTVVGEVLEIDDELVVGRGAPDLRSLGGDSLLSRRQARFAFAGSGGLVVEDLGSTNGTWVNGVRIAEPRQLHAGDEVRVGRTTLKVEEPPAARDDTVPGEKRRAAQQAAVAPSGALVLAATAGPVEGSEIWVEDSLDIGRSFEGQGALGGDRRLSRRHARIVRGPQGRFFIEDTGSSNGTFVNDCQVRAARLLAGGDEVRVGATTLTVSAPAAASAEDEGERGPPKPASVSTYVPQGAAPSRLRTGRLVTVFAGVFAAAVGISILAVIAAAPSGPKNCPNGRPCTPPPKSPALLSQTVYRSPIGWSAEYDPHVWTVTASDANNLNLADAQDDALWITAMPAPQTSPMAAIANQVSTLSGQSIGLAVDSQPQDQLFAVPAVGFHDGVGAVYGGTVNSPQGPGSPVVFEIVAAQDAKVTLVLTTATPAGRDQRSNRGFANADAVLETVRFPSDAGA